MSNLNTNFYIKLIQVSSELQMKPEDILAIMASESKLNPSSLNSKTKASGLAQILPTHFNKLNYQGTPEEFSSLAGEEQLDYIKSLIKDYISMNGGRPFTSAAQYYVANFFPIALGLPGIRSNDPMTIMLEKNPEIITDPSDNKKYSKKYYDAGIRIDPSMESGAFNANQGFSGNKTNISYQNIINVANAAKYSPEYLQAIKDLKATKSITSPPHKSIKSENSLNLSLQASIFDQLCDIKKVSFIRKLPNGKYRVVSRKGKNLGTYNTREEAAVRLRQIEFFKHKKQASTEPNYSAFIRDLKEKAPKEIILQFKKVFKELFDQAIIDEVENPEKVAMKGALEYIDNVDTNLMKSAAAIEMGDPLQAGEFLATIIKFLMRRISAERRPKSLENLKRKIYGLNEQEISGKKLPSGAALGQSITLLKQILFGHSSPYIRNVLNAVVRFL